MLRYSESWYIVKEAKQNLRQFSGKDLASSLLLLKQQHNKKPAWLLRKSPENRAKSVRNTD